MIYRIIMNGIEMYSTDDALIADRMKMLYQHQYPNNIITIE